MYNELMKTVFAEMQEVLGKTNQDDLDEAIDRIIQARKENKNIVVAGAGRMGYSIKCFGMRLSHLGFNAWTLGDSSVPYTGTGDIVIIASGSGETGTMKIVADKARENGACLIVFTCNPTSTIGLMADVGIKLNAKSSLDGSEESIQPMKTYIEQSTLVLYDIIAMMIMKKLELKNSDLSGNHSILE